MTALVTVPPAFSYRYYNADGFIMGPRPLSGTPAPIPSCNMEDDEEDVAKEACLQNYISF